MVKLGKKNNGIGMRDHLVKIENIDESTDEIGNRKGIENVLRSFSNVVDDEQYDTVHQEESVKKSKGRERERERERERISTSCIIGLFSHRKYLFAFLNKSDHQINQN